MMARNVGRARDEVELLSLVLAVPAGAGAARGALLTPARLPLLLLLLAAGELAFLPLVWLRPRLLLLPARRDFDFVDLESLDAAAILSVCSGLATRILSSE